MGSGVTAAGVYSPFLYMCLLGILLMRGEAVNHLRTISLRTISPALQK
jgi:hypothetical protein